MAASTSGQGWPGSGHRDGGLRDGDGSLRDRDGGASGTGTTGSGDSKVREDAAGMAASGRIRQGRWCRGGANGVEEVAGTAVSQRAQAGKFLLSVK